MRQGGLVPAAARVLCLRVPHVPIGVTGLDRDRVAPHSCAYSHTLHRLLLHVWAVHPHAPAFRHGHQGTVTPF